MLMSMLYDINFIIGLLITVLLSTFAYFYFSQRIDEQNEKINAISMVVRAMAEEMSYFRNSSSPVLSKEEPFVEPNDFENGLANIEMVAPVSIGGDSLKDRSNDLQLIAVSDDEPSDSDSDSEDTSRDSDSDSEDTELCSNANEEVDINVNEVEDLNENNNDKKEENVNSVHMNVGDLEELGVFEEFDEPDRNADSLNEFLNVAETKVVNMDNSGLDNVAHISLDDDHIKAHATDYKKMPLNKLRAIVTEKKLCEDASKMKKPELLELLKPFIGNVE